MAPRPVAAMAPRFQIWARAWLQGQSRPWLRSKVCCGHGSAVPDLDANLSELVAAAMVGKWCRRWKLPCLERRMEKVDAAELGGGRRDAGCDGDEERKSSLLSFAHRCSASPDLWTSLRPRLSRQDDEVGGGAEVGLDATVVRRPVCSAAQSFELEPRAQQLCRRFRWPRR
ncbi:uncharacterized protein J3R85_003367 [Psidium guajava]|nr:uncharacterized protein J3R85_003367 [Psidium guajava]